ncbi:hypothetical protein [Actinomycetospora chiangmaiensis]|uniref:hypothetical protein n=1 Tax=Actinomycetospora chiangmaiensis TaxID=402650 RepID=UPI00037502DD|nr:hypothetical protein [Actinomycetospora chiangmaiensis]
MVDGDEGPRGRSDAAVAVAVARRLENYVGWPRWAVHVAGGRVVLCDDVDDPVEQHIATLVARDVPGVASVDTTRRSRCPWHAPGAAVRPRTVVVRPADA